MITVDSPALLPHLQDLRAQLDLDTKVRLLTGADMWSTIAIPHIGLRPIVMSDGPSGVRGSAWDERSPSLNLPSATALASSWDPSIARRYGAVCAAEARRKGVDVVLGPTINLHRSPLGGRHFEALSEDPLLTADLAAAYVAGLQAGGVAATPKHYIANDSETDRFTVDVIVEERPLRELYLRAFEKAITEARAWVVMSSYNSINGATATENELLETPLNSEWGFDGVVVSDWTAVRSVNSARFSQDLAMPGPVGAWGDHLVEAVRAGTIEEEAIDRKVLRILHLAARVGALASVDVAITPRNPDENGPDFARDAAIEGTVLVTNTGILPLDPAPARIAVIGHNASIARTQGGGSATVIPESIVSPLEGIRQSFPDSEITSRIGAVVHDGIISLPLTAMTNPETGEPGARVTLHDAHGNRLYAEDRRASALVYFGGDAPIAETAVLEFHTTWIPDRSGVVDIGFTGMGRADILIDGTPVGSAESRPDSDDFAAMFLAPPAATVSADVTEGRPVDLRVVFTRAPMPPGLGGLMSVTIGTLTDTSDPDALIQDAVAAAAQSDVAVVVVGTNERVESEGYDRTTLALPGRQDDLVAAVAAANPRTIVIVNAGAPVTMPWRDDVAAVALAYFGGQEAGSALGAILSGIAEPGGRLPTTWPAAEDDVPVLTVTPTDGQLHYDESLSIGYRAWLRSDRSPAYAFGHGLGYTSWAIDALRVDETASSRNIVATLTNTGPRLGKQVVQVYASRPDSSVERPVRWLVGFAALRLGGGESATVSIPIPNRELAYWDGEWRVESGEYRLHVGFSVTDERATLTTTIA